MRKIFSNFVCFSENPNSTTHLLFPVSIWTFISLLLLRLFYPFSVRTFYFLLLFEHLFPFVSLFSILFQFNRGQSSRISSKFSLLNFLSILSGLLFNFPKLQILKNKINQNTKFAKLPRAKWFLFGLTVNYLFLNTHNHSK